MVQNCKAVQQDLSSGLPLSTSSRPFVCNNYFRCAFEYTDNLQGGVEITCRDILIPSFLEVNRSTTPALGGIPRTSHLNMWMDCQSQSQVFKADRYFSLGLINLGTQEKKQLPSGPPAQAGNHPPKSLPPRFKTSGPTVFLKETGLPHSCLVLEESKFSGAWPHVTGQNFSGLNAFC